MILRSLFSARRLASSTNDPDPRVPLVGFSRPAEGPDMGENEASGS